MKKIKPVRDPATIGIIGSADGPTTVYVKYWIPQAALWALAALIFASAGVLHALLKHR